MREIEIFGDGLEHVEAPVVCADGSVIVGEMRRNRVTRVRKDGSKQTIAELDGAPNGLAFGPDGALYCCNSGGFAWADGETFPAEATSQVATGSLDRIDISTGRVERLYDSCEGVKLAGPNDIVFDRHGGMWFTDLGKPMGDREMLGGLYYARPDGSSIKRIYAGLALNGVGLSPDGSTVYAAASYMRWIMAFPATADPQPQGHGVLTADDTIVFDYPRRRLLDSMAIEADGTIAQAVCFQNPGISRVDPRSGEESTIGFPDILTTNIAFGGPDMRTAYVTLTTTKRLARVRWPAPGLVLEYNG